MNNNTFSTEYVWNLVVRAAVWGSIFALLYLLRAFSLLLFMTFVFAYIQSHSESKLTKWFKNRTTRVIIIAMAFLGILIGIGALLVPLVKDQATVFAERFPQYLHTTDAKLEQFSKNYPLLGEAIPTLKERESSIGEFFGIDPNHEKATLNSPTLSVLGQVFGFGTTTEGSKNLKSTLDTIRNAGAFLLAVGSAFFLSLLFSFLIVLDLPRLTESVRSLQKTSIGWIYDEVAGGIYDFSKVLGQALEAQLFVALLNTVLTGIGVVLLGIPEKVAFLSVIVFLCSFIPVAGVFISSIPICLVALEQSGFQLMGLAILMIVLVHMAETYVLNPRIYGHHLRLNPVIVLIILTVAGKLFGIWGLVLGVPICTYIFGHAIRKERHSSPQNCG